MTELPRGVQGGAYRASIPLIRPSKLTRRENGGVGKDLSEGWCLNFAVGCTHACPFCYVDAIHKRFGSRYGDSTRNRWGDYLLVPENLDVAIARTPWARWNGKEVMLSSTHDPYLPQLAPWARRILEEGLDAGVRFCVQTRSYLVLKDIGLLAEHRDQVRLQVSIATMDRDFARKIEPRVPTPERRLEVLRRAKDAGLRTGVIVAPVFPPCELRPDVVEDLDELAEALSEVRPDQIYGESLHARGANLGLVREAAGEDVLAADSIADASLEMAFHVALGKHGLHGTWWPEA